MFKIDGVLLDIPDATRCFQRFTHEQRSDMRASHRLGFRQRERVGEFFWTHPYCPDVCFPTRDAARRAAIARMSRVA